MKNLALIIFTIIQSFSFAQSNPSIPNQIQISTEFEDGATLLEWELNREENSSYFLIEKSFDGKTFETLATQKAGSSTYKKTSYAYEDVESNQLAQYRVTLVLMDGKTLSILSHLETNYNVAEAIGK